MLFSSSKAKIIDLSVFSSEVLVKHVFKHFFIPIIQYSDVGIDPDAEEEMETIEAFGRQAIEEEIEMNNEDDEQDEDTALQVNSTMKSNSNEITRFSSLIINFFRRN